MTREDLLEKYIEIIKTIEKKEKKLNEICFNWKKNNQSDNEVLKKIAYMQKEIALLTIKAEKIHKEYNKIQQEDAFKRQVIVNQNGDPKENEIIAGIKFKVANNLISQEDGQELIEAIKNTYNVQLSHKNLIRR